jgi:hypothetical protein
VYLDFFQWLQTEGPIMEGDGEIKPLAPANNKDVQVMCGKFVQMYMETGCSGGSDS